MKTSGMMQSCVWPRDSRSAISEDRSIFGAEAGIGSEDSVVLRAKRATADAAYNGATSFDPAITGELSEERFDKLSAGGLKSQ